MTGLAARVGLDAVLPGSGELLQLGKTLLPYGLAIAAALGAYWWADSRGRDAQRVKDQAEITYLTGARDGWKQNAEATAQALKRANDSIDAAAKTADARVSAAHDQAESSRRASEGLSRQVVALEASALNRRAPGHECAPSEAVLRSWSQ